MQRPISAGCIQNEDLKARVRLSARSTMLKKAKILPSSFDRLILHDGASRLLRMRSSDQWLGPHGELVESWAASFFSNRLWGVLRPLSYRTRYEQQVMAVIRGI